MRRRVFAGAAVGGLLVAGAGLTTPWLDHQDAFASWTPTPAVLTGTALAEAEAECDSTSAPGATTMLAERRGVFRFLLRTDGEEVFDCLVDEAGTGGLGSTALRDLEPPDAGEAVVASYFETWGTDNGYATAVYGPVGDAVGAVTITRANGFEVQATVADGWWAAWWPGPSDGATTLTAHGDDGVTSSQVRLDAPRPLRDS